MRRMTRMQMSTPLPATGEVFLDARGSGRVLRASWHTDAGVVVLSLWREGTCAGSFRLEIEDVPALIGLLRRALDDAYDDARSSLVPGMRSADEPAG